jgi:uncharacterized protein (DUF58 family)
MIPALRMRLPAWFLRRRGPEAAPVRLTQGRIYILPTRAGAILAATLLLMLLGCINYNLGLGYLLTFLLTGVAVVSMLHTFRNLAGLQLRPGRAESVFAGDSCAFPVQIHNPTALQRRSVGLSLIQYSILVRRQAEDSPIWRDVGPGETVNGPLLLPAQQRGRLRLPRFRIFTTFPLGLFHVWSSVELDMSCIVYPRPETGEVALPPPRPSGREGMQAGSGQDDFAGLRSYRTGDSLKHVAWKAAARGQPVMTKQFTGLEAGQLWLAWSDLQDDMPVEARLSRLTRWTLDASRLGLAFAMELPGGTLGPDSGRAHEERCLTALALFGRARPGA